MKTDPEEFSRWWRIVKPHLRSGRKYFHPCGSIHAEPSEAKAPNYHEIIRKGLKEFGVSRDEYRELEEKHGAVRLKHVAELRENSGTGGVGMRRDMARDSQRNLWIEIAERLEKEPSENEEEAISLLLPYL